MNTNAVISPVDSVGVGIATKTGATVCAVIVDPVASSGLGCPATAATLVVWTNVAPLLVVGAGTETPGAATSAAVTVWPALGAEAGTAATALTMLGTIDPSVASVGVGTDATVPTVAALTVLP